MSIEANPVCTRDHEESPRLVIRLPPLFPSLALASRVSPPGILGAPSASKSRLSHQSIERRGPRGIVMVWFGMVSCFVLLPVRQPGRHATRDAPSCSSASILQLLSNLVPISGAGQTRPSHHIVHIRTSSSSPPTSCSPPSLTNTMSCTPPYSNSFQGILPNLLSVSSFPSPSRTPAVRRIRGSTASVSRTVWCVATPASYRSAK